MVQTTDANNAISKTFKFPVYYNATGGNWRTLLPLASSGPTTAGSVKGKTCAGCDRYISSRRVLKHNMECPQLLTLRLDELMDEKLHSERQYRKSMQDNETLRLSLSQPRATGGGGA